MNNTKPTKYVDDLINENTDLIKYSKIETNTAKVICNSDESEFRLIDKVLATGLTYKYETFCQEGGDIIIIY